MLASCFTLKQSQKVLFMTSKIKTFLDFSTSIHNNQEITVEVVDMNNFAWLLILLTMMY
jgi:hypothetical protein